MTKKECELCDEKESCFEMSGGCPVCHKKGAYYRKKTGDYRCPHCEHVWPRSFSELIEGPPKTVMTEAETTEALMQVAERMGYSRQETGWKPVLVFVTDEQYAHMKRSRIGSMMTLSFVRTG